MLDMSWLQFLASIVNSIVWPLTIFGIVALLRVPLTRILHSLHHLTVRGVELDFGQQLANLEQEADRVETSETATESGSTTLGEPPKDSAPGATTTNHETWGVDEEVQALAAQSPESAVLRAWIEVERSVTLAMRRLGYQDVKHVSLRHNIGVLRDGDYIDSETYQILLHLSSLRNRAIHPLDTAEISYAESLEYARLAKRMALKLDAIVPN